MLHLLPIRFLMCAFGAMVALLMLTAFYTGIVGGTDSLQIVMQVVRWTSMISSAAIILSYAAWRWIPAIQSMIFPYLGGIWNGEIRFASKDGKNDSRSVRLEAKHSLFGIKLLLESAETESRTLAVHAERDPDFARYKLYYVYRNQRKEGVAGAGEVYRGLALVRVNVSDEPTLEGNYFTETYRNGTLHLKRSSKTAFWKLWC